MIIKKVPIEVYEKLHELQGHSRISNDFIVVPYLKDLKEKSKRKEIKK